MSLPLTPRNVSLSKQISINPQAILQVEGISTIFGAQPVVEFARWDKGLRWDTPNTFWDGLTEIKDSKAVIDLSQGTTNSLTQQILPDKGGSSSVSTINIQLVDLNGEIAKIFSFDNIKEVLGKKADFYIGFKQGAFPEDALPIFRGVIVDFYTTDGIVMVSVAHPEALKRQDIYQQFQSKITAPIDTSTTIIPVSDTTTLLPSADIVRTLVRIEDEIMELVSIDSGTQLTVIRAQENTIPAAHTDTEITSIYQFTEKPIPLALKLMLSDQGNTFFNSDNLPVSINFVDITKTLSNSIIFDYFDIGDLTGMVRGDTIRLTGVNAGDYIVKQIGTLPNGSYIKVETPLITEIEFAGTFEYRSKYNVLPDGLGMLQNQVDIESHTNIEDQFPSNFVNYTINLSDTLEDTKKFIDTEVYFPQGLYQIPRKARTSVKIVTPPFSSDIVPTVDLTNIINIGNIRQRRSLHKYLYNIISYNYEHDVIDEKFLVKDNLISATSLNRIRGGRKQLKINSKGLRRGAATTLSLKQISARLIDRYKFAPTYFENIGIKYSDGFSLEVGDVLPFGGLNTKIVNLQTGERGVEAELFEVINKSLNISTGEIKVDLLSTAFSVDSRNAVVSLASGCGANSTTTRIELVNLVNVEEYINESDKWEEFKGTQVRVFSKDYTQDETVILKSVDPSNLGFLLLDSPLSFTPTTNHIIEIPEYDNTSKLVNPQYKLRFAHYVANVLITAVTSPSIFDVNSPLKLLVGSKIIVNSQDFTDDTFDNLIEHEIIDIIGSTVTIDVGLPFTPQVGYIVNRSDFLDGGKYYSII